MSTRDTFDSTALFEKYKNYFPSGIMRDDGFYDHIALVVVDVIPEEVSYRHSSFA